jgi:hypothetical protein
MKNKLFAILAVFTLLALVNPAFAVKPVQTDLPEEDGVYDVPGHKNLKLRVIVHKVKPGPGPTPTEQCNLDDSGSNAVVDWAGWKLPSIFTYSLNPNSAPSSITPSEFSTLTENSFNTWNQASSKYRMVKGTDTNISRYALDGKNIVTFGRASGSALGVTYIWYNPSTGTVTELDTILNLKFAWEWNSKVNCAYQGVYDAQDILTHEIGHWVGLDDHYTSDYRYNTMYGYGYTGSVYANTLTNGDIAGVTAIYQ